MTDIVWGGDGGGGERRTTFPHQPELSDAQTAARQAGLIMMQEHWAALPGVPRNYAPSIVLRYADAEQEHPSSSLVGQLAMVS